MVNRIVLLAMVSVLLVPDVRSVPVGKVAVVGGVVGAVKGAVKGAFLANAGALVAKNLASKIKHAAINAAVHGVTFGAGAAVGAAVVALKHHHYNHEETYIENIHQPDLYHGYYNHPTYEVPAAYHEISAQHYYYPHHYVGEGYR